MKTTILRVLFFALLLSLATRASAQTMPYDSASLQNPFLVNFGAIQDPTYMLGNPDGNSAHFTNGGECALRFRVDSSTLTMKKGQSIHIYWKIPSVAVGDSNVATIHLQNLDDNFVLHRDTSFHVWQPSVIATEEMETIIVPDTGFNTVAIGIATDTGGTSFWLDAMVLVQSGVAAVDQTAGFHQPILTNYPNPFYHTVGTHIQVHTAVAGLGMLSVTDALGREVTRMPLGELSAGEKDLDLQLECVGVFFVRLFVDGIPTGAPLEISGE
jgi:hypothetical protein